MTRTCLGFAITTFLTCGAITAATDAAFPVASTTTTSSFESFFAKASRRGRRMSTRPSRLSLPSSQATASAKARWISNPMTRMPAPPSRSKRELAGDTTSTDPRSRRIRESRKGRPCNELGLSAHCLSAACPHLRAPGAPCPRWAHPIAVSPLAEQADNKAPTDLIPDNGQVERMNRTIKEATVKRYHYENHDQLRRHLADFLDAYNFARRLKTLKGLTPYEFICKRWTIEPKRFSLNPLQQMPGLNTY